MAEEYARVVSRVVSGQLAEAEGFEAVQDSAVEVLSELLLRYLSEVSTGAHSYAELATRSEINVHDTLLAIEDMGTSVQDLTSYMSVPFMSSDANMFAHALAPFPVRRPARVMPTFEEKGEQPPQHIPAFLPAFPDAHTYEHTPSFPGHEENPDKQTQAVKQQRRAAERALVELHKRAKGAAGSDTAPTTATSADTATGTADRQGAGTAAVAAAKGTVSQARAAAAGPAGPTDGSGPFLGPPTTVEFAAHCRPLHAGGGNLPKVPSEIGIVPVPEQLLLESCPHHVVFDRRLVVRQMGPALQSLLPWVLQGTTTLTEAFQVLHPTSAGVVDAVLLAANPFRTVALRARQQDQQGQQQLEDYGCGLRMEGHVIPARLRLAALNADLAQRGSGAVAAEDLLLLLAKPANSSHEQLQARDLEAEEQMRQAEAASEAGPPDAAATTESAFQVLLSSEGAEREVAWRCDAHFENNGGPLKPGFDAGFSQDWATATRRAALAVSSRRPQEDAYREAQLTKGK